jgi:hypothetical protein
VKGTGWLNRVFSQGDDSIPTLDPNSDETPFYHAGLPIPIETELIYKPRDFPETLPDISVIKYHARRQGKSLQIRQPILIDTQHEMPPGILPVRGEPLAWGNWLEFKGDYVAALGKAVSTFLIADDPALDRSMRLVMAQKQLQIRGVVEQITAEQLLRQSDSFRAFLEQQFQPVKVLRKYSAECFQGKRLLKLEAELVMETNNGQVVIAFAPFSEGMKKWKQQATTLMPALSWWREIKKTEVQLWVIFPVEAQAVALHSL